MKETQQKYIFLLFFLLSIALSIFVIWPFIKVILGAFVIAYIFYPVYTWLKKYIKSENLTAAIVSFLVILVFTLPLILTVNALYMDIGKLYYTSKQKISGDTFAVGCEQSQDLVCRVHSYLASAYSDPAVKEILYSSLSKVSSYLLNFVTSIVVSLPKIMLDIFILLFVLFYLFREGEYIAKQFTNLLPFSPGFRGELLSKTKDMMYATIYGTIVVVLIQGAIATGAFIVLGSTSSPFFWGLMVAIASIIPYVGTAIIWVPIAINQILNGYLSGSRMIIFKGVVLVLVGIFVISIIDNLLKPKIIGNRSNVHPVLVLLGALGGLNMMGLIGVIIGPLILTFFVSFAKVYQEEKKILICE